MTRLHCVRCKRCLCERHHPRGECIDRRRRIFLLGALAAPVIASLPVAPLARDVATGWYDIQGNALTIERLIAVGGVGWFAPAWREGTP